MSDMYIKFKSSQPYLQLSYRNLFSDTRLDKAVTFTEGEYHDTFISTDPEVTKALRAYAERTKDQAIIMELTVGCKVWEFLEKHRELEEKLIKEVEDKEQATIEANKQKEIYETIRGRL